MKYKTNISSQFKKAAIRLFLMFVIIMIEHFLPQWKNANYFIHWIFFITQTPSWSINFPTQFMILVSLNILKENFMSFI